MVHLLIGSTCNISGLMTKCSEVYGELQNVQEQSMEFARLERTFLVDSFSDIISFVIIVLIIHSKFSL